MSSGSDHAIISLGDRVFQAETLRRTGRRVYWEEGAAQPFQPVLFVEVKAGDKAPDTDLGALPQLAALAGVQGLADIPRTDTVIEWG